MILPLGYSHLSDSQLVALVCSDNERAVTYFFYKKYLPVFQYHVYKLFPRGQDVLELVNEFFLYLHEDNWRRLRTFNGTASLNTWISVISWRFFKNFKHSKIDSNGLIAINDKWESFAGDWVQSQDAGLTMDIRQAIGSIAGDRDRRIAEELLLEDREPKDVAEEHGLATDYLYTVKNRVLKQLKERLKSYRT